MLPAFGSTSGSPLLAGLAPGPSDPGHGDAHAPRSYAGVVSRATPYNPPPSSGVWRELHTVAFKPRDCHLASGQFSHKSLRAAIISSLTAARVIFSVDCLQILKDRSVKLVFKDAPSAQSFFDRGFALNGVNVPLRAPQKPATRVVLQDLPYHMPAFVVRAFMSAFGEVTAVAYRRPTDSLKTGDRIVTIALKQNIPRHVVVGGYHATVFYGGQPPFCEICRGEHLTSRCPLKGRCRRCREPGHLGRNCPQRDACAECEQGGHVRLDCPSLVDCRLCGVRGHLPDDCPSVTHVSGGLSEEVEVDVENVQEDMVEEAGAPVVQASVVASPSGASVAQGEEEHISEGEVDAQGDDSSASPPAPVTISEGGNVHPPESQALPGPVPAPVTFADVVPPSLEDVVPSSVLEDATDIPPSTCVEVMDEGDAPSVPAPASRGASQSAPAKQRDRNRSPINQRAGKKGKKGGKKKRPSSETAVAGQPRVMKHQDPPSVQEYLRKNFGDVSSSSEEDPYSANSLC